MIRTKILGLGSYAPDRIVENATSDLGLAAAQRALADAGVEAAQLDGIIFGTMSPDVQAPGTGVLLQRKLGIAEDTRCACFDLRRQCSAFIYGLQMADAFVRTGLYHRVLLVGAELHGYARDVPTRSGAGAIVLGPMEADDPRSGVIYTSAHADGAGAMDLCLKIFDLTRRPAPDHDAPDLDPHQRMYPSLEGKRVFLDAVRGMVRSARAALANTGLGWDDIHWFVPHQANLRIDENVVEVANIPRDKVLSAIQRHGNTAAATVPLTIDHWRQQGRVKRGDRILSSVFGSGFTWGAAIFTC
jgi:3-oxoacyl-[acyl-carrier-protein] synthase III